MLIVTFPLMVERASPATRPATNHGGSSTSKKQAAGEQLQHLVIELAPGVTARGMVAEKAGLKAAV